MTTTSVLANGAVFTTSALTVDAAQTVMQAETCAMLGIITSPVAFVATLTVGSENVTYAGSIPIYVGQQVAGTGVPAGAYVSAVGTASFTLSAAATASGAQTLTLTDAACYSKVRVGWQTEGQPAWRITDDVAIVRMAPVDRQYNRIRNTSYAEDLLQHATYTKVWRAEWTFYGPNAEAHAEQVRSGLFLDFCHNALSLANLYLVMDVESITRSPELFQGQWWERTDFRAEFYEQVNETLTMEPIASAEIVVDNSTGVVADIEVS